MLLTVLPRDGRHPMHRLNPAPVLHLPGPVLRGRQQAVALLRQNDLLQGQRHDLRMLVPRFPDRLRSGLYRNLFVAGTPGGVEEQRCSSVRPGNRTIQPWSQSYKLLPTLLQCNLK